VRSTMEYLSWVGTFLAAFLIYLIITRCKKPPKRNSPSVNYNATLWGMLVDPLVSGLHSYVAAKVPSGSKAVDACCGTGQLVFKLATNCSEVVGIDLSPQMIRAANKKKERLKNQNSSFVFGDVTEVLQRYDDDAFDFATISMAFHAMPKIFRVPMLKQLSRVAKKVIAVDYASDMPFNTAGIHNRILEFVAGAEHFSNFRNFRHEGGLHQLATETNLVVEESKLVNQRTILVVTLHRRY